MAPSARSAAERTPLKVSGDPSLRETETGRPEGPARSTSGVVYATAPWHFLYFLPLPQGHGALRGTLSEIACGAAPLFPPPPPPPLGVSSPCCIWTRCGRGRAGSSCRTSSTR